MKTFLLVRAESGRVYLYNRETWEYMAKRDNTYMYTLVAEHDDPEILKGFQKLVNKDIEVKD